jgi:EAL domain-containing protein (putative c-di-GMP-specific phosphodiesterase class I)
MAIMAGIAGAMVVAVLFLGRSQRGRAGRKSKKVEQDGIVMKVRRVLGNWMASIIKKFPTRILGSKAFKDASLVIHDPNTKSTGTRSKPSMNWGGIFEGVFFLFGLLFFASIILLIFGFTRPLTRSVPADVNYQQTGNFSYTAAAQPGIYDSAIIQTGEPLFLKLTDSLNIKFQYALEGEELQEIAGTYQLVARVVDDQSGWQRTIPLKGMTTFTGETFTSNATIDLRQIQTLIDTLEQKTEFRQSFYSLVIIPQVTITGKIMDRALQDSFEPSLVFRFDKLHLYLTGKDPEVDPLNPTKSGLLSGFRIESNKFQLFGKDIDVSKIRNVSLTGLGISLSGLVILGFLIIFLAKRSHESLIKMKYDSMMVDAQNHGFETKPGMIDVSTIDDLAKLAERYNSMILHVKHDLAHYYLVQENGATYRFAIIEGMGLFPAISLPQLEEELRKGLERGEFQVYYQPVVSLTDGKIAAVEALLRWRHPEHGLITAGEFIQGAEATRMIGPIDEWMLQSACTQLNEWQQAGLPLRLSVNLTEQQLESDPIKRISGILKSTGVNPRNLQIEVNESNMLEHTNIILPGLQQLQKLGVQVSMDNYSGQSTLSTLGQLPINGVKVNRHLIEKISHPEGSEIVGKMIAAALGLGLNVIGEGVETEEQQGFLRSQSCTQAQGYLLGRPAPAYEVTQLLQERKNEFALKVSDKRGRNVKGVK